MVYPVEKDSTAAMNRGMQSLKDARRKRDMDAQFVKRSEFDALLKRVEALEVKQSKVK
jgi:hypothetical protein